MPEAAEEHENAFNGSTPDPWAQLLFLHSVLAGAPNRPKALHPLDTRLTSFYLARGPIETAMFCAAASKLAELADVVNLQVNLEGEADLIIGFGADAQDARRRLLQYLMRCAERTGKPDLDDVITAIRALEAEKLAGPI